MHCASCASNVERALKSLPGIGEVSVNYAVNQASIRLLDESFPISLLVDTVRNAGYGVETDSRKIIVEGMSCAACAISVERILRSSPGVLKADVNLASQSAELTVLQGMTDIPSIISRINETGFTASLPGKEQSGNSATRLHEKEFYRNRSNFVIAGIGATLVMFFSMTSLMRFGIADWLALLFTLVILVTAGREFFIGAWKQFRRGSADMNSLIALGTGSAFLFSAFTMMFPHESLSVGEHHGLYFESAAMIITLILLGRTLESRAKAKASEAVSGLLELAPSKAHLVQDDLSEMDVPTSDLTVGDKIRVKPGEKVPVDGVLIEGEPEIDESFLTGESYPIQKSLGDNLYGGTINVGNSLILRAVSVGNETLLAGIARLVEQAQGSKPPIQKLADKISAVFVPIVLLLAIISFSIWMIFGPYPQLSGAINVFVSVLIIACPCAMGLATPTAVMVGSGRAAKKGIIFKNGEALERVDKLNLLVIDKTGTLTEGRPAVTSIESMPDVTHEELMAIAAGMELHSSHPLARAVIQEAVRLNVTPLKIDRVSSISGRGMVGFLKEENVIIGKLEWIGGEIKDALSLDFLNAWSCRDKSSATTIAVGRGDRLLGILEIDDRLRPGTKAAVTDIQHRGIKIVMATGDREVTAKKLAVELGIDEVYFGLLPARKLELIDSYRQKGFHVGMVGDGINDAPALSAADVGFAIGSGSDIALEASDVTLFGTDISTISRAILIGRTTVRRIKQNLFWAFFYNTISIPLAAGLLYPLTGHLLSPMIAAATMAFSSVSVVLNSLRSYDSAWGKNKASTTED